MKVAAKLNLNLKIFSNCFSYFCFVICVEVSTWPDDNLNVADNLEHQPLMRKVKLFLNNDFKTTFSKK